MNESAPHPAHATDPLIGMRAGRYVIVAGLAHAAMGAVYTATHEDPPNVTPAVELAGLIPCPSEALWDDPEE